jgi:hypothetical protein
MLPPSSALDPGLRRDDDGLGLKEALMKSEVP